MFLIYRLVIIYKMREFKPILALEELKQSRQITVHVMTHDGKESLITVYAGDQIKAIKEKILGEEGAKDVPNYKVILLSPRRVLEDQKTIEQEGLIDDDRFLIFPKRKDAGNPFKYTSSSIKGPDLPAIKKATLHIGEEKGTAATNTGIGCPGMFDFFGELKKILISLTEVASLLQYVNNDEEQNSDTEAEDHDIPIDPLCLGKLTDMGFSEPHCRKALIINRMCPVQAMEWLLLHSEDVDIDRPLTSDELASYIPESRIKGKRSLVKKKEFVPNPRSVNKLKEMGFSESEVLDALKYSANNQERALDWLLGDRQTAEVTPDGGLDPQSPLYIAIMDHPVVQLGMTNPRILHAFEDMLENPNNSGQYINDPEIGPVLLQISRIVQSFSR
ncbi:ubiquitin-associated domain-containing protein 1 isoform X1 [Hydra vulgaris]|uniref:ubiquitin-associated domain-containing protein 1 isoform X1 n=1 Tax=Hydra vulgaris TaxID=6087 RepID=UPI0032EA0597